MKKDDCNCFFDQFKTFPLNIQNIVLKKLHSNTTMWNLKDHISTIDVSQLTNARKWLSILVGLLNLTTIDWILPIYQFMCMNEQVEHEKFDINKLLKRLMPKDHLQVKCAYNDKIYYHCNNGNEID